jgi:hypothetical protein
MEDALEPPGDTAIRVQCCCALWSCTSVPHRGEIVCRSRGIAPSPTIAPNGWTAVAAGRFMCPACAEVNLRSIPGRRRRRTRRDPAAS